MFSPASYQPLLVLRALMSTICRLLKFSLTVIVVVSVVYTTCDLLLYPVLLHSKTGQIEVSHDTAVSTAWTSAGMLSAHIFDEGLDAAGQAISDDADTSAITSNAVVNGIYPEQRLGWSQFGRVRGVERNRDAISWNTSTDGWQTTISAGRYSMPADYFMSKVFSNSLQPSETMPFFYQGKEKPQMKDITITTLVTSDRFHILAELAEQYQGPISATVHVSNEPQTRALLLQALKDTYSTSKAMQEHVDIHLVIDNFDRQFNMWRNIARYFARTAYVMMLDVDFAICTDFRSRVLANAILLELLEGGRAAFVLPAFEYIRDVSNSKEPLCPVSKEALLPKVLAGDIAMFHASWKPGHGATNYSRWYDMPPGEIYKVSTYTAAYEPYIIVSRDNAPFCDERFIGYGANKAACIYEMYISGISFYVLPVDFIVHQSHQYAESARKNERRYNRKLYNDFREEACYRYLLWFVDDNQLGMRAARNLLTECKKVKGFSSAAHKLVAQAIARDSAITA